MPINRAVQPSSLECKATVVDLSVDSTTVFAGPAILVGLYVNTALSAHPLLIKDDTATVLTIPASLAAGQNLTWPGIRFETSLVLDPDNVATGNVTVLWMPV